MPRPSIEHKIRPAVDAYIVAALTKPAEEAQLNVLAVARQTRFDRKTLKKYGLDAEIAAAAKRQSGNEKASPRELWKSLPMPNRSVSHAGAPRNNHR